MTTHRLKTVGSLAIHRATRPFLAALVLVGLLGSTAALASHSPGVTERISVDSDGNQANGISGRRGRPAVNGDGSVVAFDSLASNLVPGDTNARDDIFVRDRAARETELISVSSSGVQGIGESVAPSISSDGNIVAFQSSATNLVSDDTNEVLDVFVRDRSTGTTVRVSVASDETQGDASSFGAAVSADGRFVTFVSDASNLVPDKTSFTRDVYVRDRLTGTTERVSLSSDGAEANGFSTPPDISADGRFVAFGSLARNLVSGDANGTIDIFVHDRATGTTERVSVDSAGSEANGQSVGPGVRGGSAFGSDISADGRLITFDSIATNLVAEDTNTCQPPALAPFSVPGQCPDIFVHDRQTGITHRVSIDSARNQSNHASTDPAISGDGQVTAFFSLASNLVAGDTNTCQAGIAIFDDPGECPDIFIHDVSGRVFAADADLSVTKSASPDPARIGRNLTYTIVVSNNGPALATRVKLTDTLPANVHFLSATSSTGSCTQAAGTITCDLGRLTSGAQVTVTIVVRPIKLGTIVNTVSVTGRQPDPDGANNTATAETAVITR